MWNAISEAAIEVGQLSAESACSVQQLGPFPLSATSAWTVLEQAARACRLQGGVMGARIGPKVLTL